MTVEIAIQLAAYKQHSMLNVYFFHPLFFAPFVAGNIPHVDLINEALIVNRSWSLNMHARQHEQIELYWKWKDKYTFRTLQAIHIRQATKSIKERKNGKNFFNLINCEEIVARDATMSHGEWAEKSRDFQFNFLLLIGCGRLAAKNCHTSS